MSRPRNPVIPSAFGPGEANLPRLSALGVEYLYRTPAGVATLQRLADGAHSTKGLRLAGSVVASVRIRLREVGLDPAVELGAGLEARDHRVARSVAPVPHRVVQPLGVQH